MEENDMSEKLIGLMAAGLSVAGDREQRLRDALVEIERIYYMEGKDVKWRAARMRAVANTALND